MSSVDEEIVHFSYQPHPAQVISIFLCLGLAEDQYTTDLKNKIAEIGTGEGKSLVLAGMASYLALSGF